MGIATCKKIAPCRARLQGAWLYAESSCLEEDVALVVDIGFLNQLALEVAEAASDCLLEFLLFLFLVELSVALLLVEHLISIDGSLALEARLEVALLGLAYRTAQGGLACTDLRNEGVAHEGDVVDGIGYCAFHLSHVGYALCSLHLLLKHGSLLVLHYFAGQVFADLLVVPGKITFLVDACKCENQQVVVLATLIEGRYIANLGLLVEDPAESLSCAAYVYDVVLGAAESVRCSLPGLHWLQCPLP